MHRAAEDIPFDFLHMEAVKMLVDESDVDSGINKLEQMGYSTGYRLVDRLTRDTVRHHTELDDIKYVCRVVWVAVFGKEVNTLRTDNQGRYVLHDDTFRFFSALAKGTQYLKHTPKYVAFSCGLVRGCLANLGLTCVVTAEVTQLPQCKFELMVQRR